MVASLPVLIGHRIDLIDDRHLAVGVDVVVLGPNANIAGGKNQVGLVHRVHHVHDRELMSLQLYRIDVDLDLAILAAVGLGNRGARYVRDLVSDLELRKILELRLIHPFALERDQADRKVRSVET